MVCVHVQIHCLLSMYVHWVFTKVWLMKGFNINKLVFTDLFLSQICLCCSFHFLLLILHPLSTLHACMTFASTNSPAMPSSPPLIHLYMLLLAYLPPHLPLVTTPAYLPAASLPPHPPLISPCLSTTSPSLSYLPASLSSHPPLISPCLSTDKVQ